MLSAPSTDRGVENALGGEVRTYAGGRQRFVGVEGDRGTVSLRLRLLTLTQVEQLESWRGRTVQIRDHRGQRFWAVYKEVQRIEHKNPALYDATITANTVTVDEGV